MDIKPKGKKLKEVRESSGISISDMATKLGLTTMDLSFYEDGIIDAPNNIVEEIASICSVDISVFDT